MKLYVVLIQMFDTRKPALAWSYTANLLCTRLVLSIQTMDQTATVGKSHSLNSSICVLIRYEYTQKWLIATMSQSLQQNTVGVSTNKWLFSVKKDCQKDHNIVYIYQLVFFSDTGLNFWY